MPITRDELIAANAAMLGNTNRGILFTKVNVSKDAPKLSDMLSDLQAGIYTWEQFRMKVVEQLTVRSFPEFLDKFQPCFYFRVAAPAEVPEVTIPDSPYAPSGTTETEPGSESDEDEEGDDTTEEGEAADGEPIPEVDLTFSADSAESQEPMDVAKQLPHYEFSLEGGPASLGWKRVNITMDHPLFKCLSMHLREKALTSKTTAMVDIDDALFGYKPASAESQMRKSAKDFQSASKKLVLEMKRNAKSPETKAALKSFDRCLAVLENAVSDDLRVLPAITSGLAQARKALGSGPSSGATAMGAYVLEIGRRGKVDVKPTEITAGNAAAAINELGDVTDKAQLGSGSRELVLISDALNSRQLARRDVKEIVTLSDEDQFPALVGSLMNDLVARHKIQPMMGNMLAVVLQDPKAIAEWNIIPRELDVMHDTFLGVYSMAVEEFLRKITPLFETLMGVYCLYNEFPYDVRKGQPELILANDDLTEIWQNYQEEICNFFRSACHQANNQYRDAISFVIVPGVSPLKGKAPKRPPAGMIYAGTFEIEYHVRPKKEEGGDVSGLSSEFDDLRDEDAGDLPGYGKICGAGELLGLLTLGSECGFAVFFSPENKVIAGRCSASDLDAIEDNYSPMAVVDKDWSVSGVLCLPDFTCIPPDGLLFTGKVMDGRTVGVEVPELVVRSCYVAAGRFMSNDNPEVLASNINKLSAEMKKRYKVRPTLPGLSLDLGKYPVLGRTNLAPDHFLSDEIVKSLLKSDKSFLIFNHVFGQPPHIAASRTLSRYRSASGDRYVMLSTWRQQIYLKRLLYAAYQMAGGGDWPNPEEMAGLMEQITMWLSWYDKNREGYVNAFPSELNADVIDVEPQMQNGELASYSLNLALKAAVLGPLVLSVQ